MSCRRRNSGESAALVVDPFTRVASDREENFVEQFYVGKSEICHSLPILTRFASNHRMGSLASELVPFPSKLRADFAGLCQGTIGLRLGFEASHFWRRPGSMS